MAQETVAQTLQRAKRCIAQFTTGRLTAIDFGMGWAGAKEGISRVMAVYGLDTHRHLLGEEIGYTQPDMRMDFVKGGGDLVTKARTEARLRQDELIFGHFSPNCTEETILQFLEKAQGRGSGARTEKGRSQKQAKAVEEVVIGIVKYRDRVPEWSYTVEQPRGSAMAEIDIVKQYLGEPIEVRQCCYGYLHCKPTWVWTNLYPDWWQPRDFKQGQCRYCQACNTGEQHAERMTRRDADDHRPQAGTSTMPGYARDARYNRVNCNLAEEWAKAARRRWETLQGKGAK